MWWVKTPQRLSRLSWFVSTLSENNHVFVVLVWRGSFSPRVAAFTDCSLLLLLPQIWYFEAHLNGPAFDITQHTEPKMRWPVWGHANHLYKLDFAVLIRTRWLWVYSSNHVAESHKLLSQIRSSNVTLWVWPLCKMLLFVPFIYLILLRMSLTLRLAFLVSSWQPQSILREIWFWKPSRDTARRERFGFPDKSECFQNTQYFRKLRAEHEMELVFSEL